MTDLTILWIIQLAPLAAFLFIQLLPRKARKIAPAVGVLATASAAVAAVTLLLRHLDGTGLPAEYARRWLFVSDAPLWAGLPRPHNLSVGFLVDPLNLLMITLVTTISFFVQVFSVYYMAEDPSRPRYFGFLSFFSFSMTGLVLSNNLLQTFIFWELVGLTSYLLIGFWYEKPSAATAARKAFVLNRLGDLGFYLGVVLLFIMLGTLNFLDLKSDMLNDALLPSTVTTIGVLVFMGVMGKSAQFPLHVWLPDAMEGPTPVSALIHSATMVAAGVFLLCRGFGLFGASEITLKIVLITGALTAFVGASLATIQRDIKRIMAYSTVSQLGLMVMAIGAGSTAAGMFHLSTHAYFKSLLFLTAGAFIHRFHTNDIWEIGQKGGKKDTLALAMLAFGLLSLVGLPPFAGFFSKDMILEALKEHHAAFYGIALAVSFLTVYYSSRLFFVIALSKPAHENHEKGHGESFIPALCRALPLLLLAALSLYAGYLGTPYGGHKLLSWLGLEEHGAMDVKLVATTLGLFVVAAASAFFFFRNPDAAEKRLAGGRDPVKIVLERKFFMDDLYAFLVKQIGLRIASALNWFDKTAINGLMVNRTSYGIKDLGAVIARLQNGLLQDYLSLAIAVGVVILLVMNWKLL